MYIEIRVDGRVITDQKKAERLFQEAGLVKTSRFTYFCDIIGAVGKMLKKSDGTIDRITYDYDEKSGIIKCSLAAYRADNGTDRTLDFFRYMLDRVDVFEVVPTKEGLSMTFEIWDIFSEEADVIQTGR